MNRDVVGGALLALCLIVAGCAAPRSHFPEVDASLTAQEAEKQREVIVQDAIDGQLRLDKIAAPLLIAAAPICPQAQRPVVGLHVTNRDAFQGEYRPVAARLLGLDDRLKVIAVHQGTPAEAAGFAAGDILVSLDGETFARGPGALVAAAKQLATAAHRDPEGFAVVVERGDATKVLRLAPLAGCDYTVELAAGEEINAFADGQKIVVTRGMMRFAASDEELALVIGHELAHNAMGHMDAQRQNAVGGAAGGLVLDILAAAVGVNTGGAFTRAGMNAGSQAFSVEFEQEADYVGLYIMARAGYPIDEAPSFWRRMATVNPESVELAGTHPTTTARFVALDQAASEINGKIASGAPLLPEMRPEEAPAPLNAETGKN